MAAAIDLSYSLEGCYLRDQGPVYLTGTQALVLLPLLQRRRDQSVGLNTAGFISGYRGSPLGGYDQALWRAQSHLEKHHIQFQPGLNEELGATAVAGSQQVEAEGDAARYDGVFGLFYAKGPGIDRAGDALKHGNAAGSSPNGGVLVVAGDDHGSISSSMSHQSDCVFKAWSIPVLSPANLQDYLTFGLYGWALSRFSGAWVGFTALSETVESAGVVTLPDTLPLYDNPVNYLVPEGGLHYRSDLPGMHIEQRLYDKLEAVRAFSAANSIDELVSNPRDAELGIVSTGKGYLDLMQALSDLGIAEHDLDRLGIRLYKLGLTYPLEPTRMLAFARGLKEILVVEEKAPFVEEQLKALLYDHRRIDTSVIGKRDAEGKPLIPLVEELRPNRLRPVLRRWLKAHRPDVPLRAIPREVPTACGQAIGKRVPYFCAGCPHNTSTKVPEGSRAYGGIGCHYMARWMKRDTEGLIQMGGEGVNWVGLAPFTETGHVFQNLGDGTFYHSGTLAIRSTIAAGVDITYKILVNDAVAMTGGQPVEGQPSVEAICEQLDGEGVKTIVVMSDDIARFQRGRFPKSVEFQPRDELDAVQNRLKQIPGVTALVYVQTCAAEKRRRRKRGKYPDPARRLVINEQVCEGCGDCSSASNCIAIMPVDTEWGRKRRIDQTACNKDYSCNNGFCPSFVTVVGGRLRQLSRVDEDELKRLVAQLPEPDTELRTGDYNLLVTGVGGTGIVTVGALICMAAKLEGNAASVLDFMGFAQKGGAVVSHVRLAKQAGSLRQVRIDRERADALIACDLVVANQQETLETLKTDARVVASVDVMPTAELVLNPDKDLNAVLMLQRIHTRVGRERTLGAAFRQWAERLTGNNIGANIMQLGYAWQRGLVPVSRAALERAIELNGVAVEANRRIFSLGRVLAEFPEALSAWIEETDQQERDTQTEDLKTYVARRVDYLSDYQDAAYADRYHRFVASVKSRVDGRVTRSESFVRSVANNLFKLMAYKDEYEVARLHSDPQFLESLSTRFEEGFKLEFHLVPPFFARKNPQTKAPMKRRFGAWILPVFRGLAALRRLRGTPVDLFGYTEERRMERALIERYCETIESLLPTLNDENLHLATELADLPGSIRGYGYVKLKSIKESNDKQVELLEKFASHEALANAA